MRSLKKRHLFTESNVRLLVIGETSKKTNKCFYAHHADRNERAKKEALYQESAHAKAR
jgi:hypothetical protein